MGHNSVQGWQGQAGPRCNSEPECCLSLARARPRRPVAKGFGLGHAAPLAGEVGPKGGRQAGRGKEKARRQSAPTSPQGNDGWPLPGPKVPVAFVPCGLSDAEKTGRSQTWLFHFPRIANPKTQTLTLSKKNHTTTILAPGQSTSKLLGGGHLAILCRQSQMEGHICWIF